jgi:hypothetical protein
VISSRPFEFVKPPGLAGGVVPGQPLGEHPCRVRDGHGPANLDRMITVRPVVAEDRWRQRSSVTASAHIAEGGWDGLDVFPGGAHSR